MASLSVTITLFGPEPIIDELYSHNDISDVDMDSRKQNAAWLMP